MNIQTISIVVPTRGCVNSCPFCVSRMHNSPYENNFDTIQLTKRIKYAMMNGVNTCIITGTGEALQNPYFLGRLSDVFRIMKYPFPNVELQTTGVMLMDHKQIIDADSGESTKRYDNIALLKDLGVNTISLSVANIFSSTENMETIGAAEKLHFNLDSLIAFLRKRGFNVRLSLNMLKDYDGCSPSKILRTAQELGANQVTFRKMYSDGIGKEAAWVKENACSPKTLENIKKYIEGPIVKVTNGKPIRRNGEGKFLYTLPFGGKVYSIYGMSTVIDDDCMSENNHESLKYIVLRENGKLYCRWDDEGSLIF